MTWMIQLYPLSTLAAGDTGLAELFSAQGALFTKGVDEFKNLASVQKS